MHYTDKPYLNGSNIGQAIEELIKTIWMRYGNNAEVDILIVGGSALALKYNLRGTCDIDAELRSNNLMLSECIKETARRVPDLFPDFINSDFMKSYSYSRYLWNHAILSRTYGGIRIFIIDDIAQLVMKMVSGRDKDIQDAKFLAKRLCYNGVHYSRVLQVHQELYGNSEGTKIKPRIERNVKPTFKRARLL